MSMVSGTSGNEVSPTPMISVYLWGSGQAGRGQRRKAVYAWYERFIKDGRKETWNPYHCHGAARHQHARLGKHGRVGIYQYLRAL